MTMAALSDVTPEMLAAMRPTPRPPPERLSSLEIVNRALEATGVDRAAEGGERMAMVRYERGRDMTYQGFEFVEAPNPITAGVGAWRSLQIEPRYLVEAPNMTATELEARLQQFVQEAADRLRETCAIEHAATTLRIADIQMLPQQETMVQRTRFLGDFATFGTALLPTPGDYGEQRHRFEELAEAEARGLQLLKEWLSPAQLEQYERVGSFEVTGSHSRKRYRIRPGLSYNVDELDADGREVMRYCFVPEGSLVLGDQMLAQKVALETDEKAALKVANREGAPVTVAWYIQGNPDPRPGVFGRLFQGVWF